MKSERQDFGAAAFRPQEQRTGPKERPYRPARRHTLGRQQDFEDSPRLASEAAVEQQTHNGIQRLQTLEFLGFATPILVLTGTHDLLNSDDDLKRNLTLAQLDKTESLRHIGLVGDTYTILLAGADTAGRYCLIDMHIPPGGGPPPHRHDFEETFILLEGELEATFRGTKSVIKAGDTVNIPANAPHQFHNASSKAVRLLCICSPSGQEDFFLAVGVLVKTRTTPPPKLDAAAQAELKTRVEALAPKYKTELLEHA